jgi:hypothetical protein
MSKEMQEKNLYYNASEVKSIFLIEYFNFIYN